MPFLCINCDHNMTTILADGGYDPNEICFLCVEKEATRIAILDMASERGEEIDYILEHLLDDVLA